MIKSSSRNSLFFIELIISIFFFILVAAVCLQLFVKSHILSQQSMESTHAIHWCQNVAEIFLGHNGDFTKVKDYFASSDAILRNSSLSLDTLVSADDILLLYLDQNWTICSDIEHANYFLIAISIQDENFSHETIYVGSLSDSLPDTVSYLLSQDTSNKTDEWENTYNIIESLQVKKYIPQ